MSNKNFIIAIVILAISAVIGITAYLPARIDNAAKTKVDNFPKEIGKWKGTDIKLDESVYQILETRNLFVRDYKNAKGDVVTLYLVYSEDNRKVSHPPEVCFMGSGMNILNKSTINVLGKVMGIKLFVEKGPAHELIVYWYKVGPEFTATYLGQQTKVVFGRLLGRRAAGALIRLSTSVKDDDSGQALELIRSFSKEMVPLLHKYLP